MPKAGLSANAVVAAALAEVDQRGASALTIAAVARRCGVAAPSLYKHVADVASLRQAVTRHVLDDLTAEVLPVVTGRSGYEALSGFMRTWREFAVTHPNRYALLAGDVLHDPGTREAAIRLINVLLAVLEGYGLTGSEAIHHARGIRSAVHGFVTLEVGGGFGLPEELDISFERLIHMVTSSIATPSPRRSHFRRAGR